MAYHENVAMIVAEAAALRELAVGIKVSVDAFEKRYAEAEAKARACRYPLREFRSLAPSIKAKIAIPEAARIVSAPPPPLDIPAHLRRT